MTDAEPELRIFGNLRRSLLGQLDDETASVVRLAVVSDESPSPTEPTAEQRMWAYYVTERSKGRTPSGAELERVAGPSQNAYAKSSTGQTLSAPREY